MIQPMIMQSKDGTLEGGIALVPDFSHFVVTFERGVEGQEEKNMVIDVRGRIANKRNGQKLQIVNKGIVIAEFERGRECICEGQIRSCESIELNTEFRI